MRRFFSGGGESFPGVRIALSTFFPDGSRLRELLRDSRWKMPDMQPAAVFLDFRCRRLSDLASRHDDEVCILSLLYSLSNST